MARLEQLAYRGDIECPGGEYEFCAAGPQDAGELAGMYAAVAITKSNYRQKLMRGPGDFSETGGMFLIHDKESIVDEMNRNRSLFGVVRNPAGKACAMLWVCAEDPAFDAFMLDSRETLMFAREIIANRENRLSLASIMYYTVFAALKGMGYTHSVGEVYKVLEFEDAGAVYESKLLNERSLQSILKTGAAVLGQNPARRVEVKDIPITALIEPHIVYFDYSRVLPALERRLLAEGIRVRFKEAGR
jgi:hypothetical protein